MNTLDNRKSVKRKKVRSPTLEGFEEGQPSKKTNVSHSLPSDQGWDRCKSGFDEEIIEEELISKSPWKAKAHKASKNKSSSRSAKFAPKTASDLQIEGSEEEEGIEEEPGDVDINWSSSEESNLSEQALVCDVSPDPKVLLRASERQKKERFTLATAATSKFKRILGTGQRLSKEQNIEIEDVGDDEGGNNDNKQISGSKYHKRTVSQASSLKSDANIDDYDSPAEETRAVSASCSVGSEPSQNSGSAQISELSPSPIEDVVAEDIASTSTQITGSQWIKRLILPVESPEKEAGGEEVTKAFGPGGDSAKKKKKFVKSGLAERLQKLANREKSSVAFWNHQLADTKKQPQGTNTSTLTVEVQSMEHLQGLYITRCRQLTPDQQASTTQQASTAQQSSTNEQQVFVLFSHSTGENLKIAVGLRVRIHPPWQKLTLPNYNEPVILSTYFCQSLGHGETDDDDRTGDVDVTLTEAATPHAAGLSPVKKPFQPLRLFEGISCKPSAHITTSGSLLESITSVDAKKVISDSILDCIAESGAYSASGICIRARVQRVYCKRINSPLNQGISRPLGLGRQQTSPSSASHTLQWIMLLQDSHGVFCELQLPIDTADRPKWKDHIQHGEGKVLTFSGVKVVHRTNRSRSPGLFSLIDSVSSPCDRALSQDFSSQSESEMEDCNPQGSKKMKGQQNFCYTLGFQLGQGTVEDDLKQEKEQICFSPSQASNLKSILQEATPTQRVSFYASVLHTSPETNTELPGHSAIDSASTQHTGWHILLSHPSLKMTKEEKNGNEGEEDNVLLARRAGEEENGVEYVYLHVRSVCVLNGLDMAVTGQFGSQVFCKDVCLQPGGSLYADIYSAILKLDNNCQGCDRITGCHKPEDGDIMTSLSRVTMPTISKLTDTTTEHSLVSVGGKITGVDESTAYSWPVCPTCGNEKLQGDDSGSQLRCGKCNLSISDPVIKMHLEVFVDCKVSHNNNKTIVKIKLQQTTIKSFLAPQTEQEDGYDINCILGKTLEPTRCFLSAITVLPTGERCMELEETSVLHG